MFDERRYGMSKRDYLKTFEGQLQRHNWRFSRRYSHHHFPWKTKSKKAMSDEEKILFQTDLLASMRKHGRRAHTGEVAMHLWVGSEEKNPPHIFGVTKNLLDLFGRPVNGSVIRRKGLLYHDDSQICYLCVRYDPHADSNDLIVSVAPFGEFLEDVGFASDISHEAPLEYGHDDEVLEKRDRLQEDCDALCDIRDGSGIYELLSDAKRQEMLPFQMSVVQRGFLDKNAFSLHSLHSIFFDRIFAKKHPGHEYLLGKATVFLPLLDMHIGKVPETDGDNEAYLNEIRTQLKTYRKKHSWIVPLFQSVLLQAVYKPPRISASLKDLDNLMTQIIKMFAAEFGPVHQLKMDATTTKSQHCVSGYEILRIPRDNTTEPGSLRIGITGNTLSCWDQVVSFVGIGT